METAPAITPVGFFFQLWRAIAAVDLGPGADGVGALHNAEQEAMDAVANATATDLGELLCQVALLARLAADSKDPRFEQVADAIRATGAALGVGDVANAIVGDVKGLAGMLEEFAAVHAAAFEVAGNA